MRGAKNPSIRSQSKTRYVLDFDLFPIVTILIAGISWLLRSDRK